MELSKRQKGELISRIERYPMQITPDEGCEGYYSFYHTFKRYVEGYFNGKLPPDLHPEQFKMHQINFDIQRTWYDLLLAGWDTFSNAIELPFDTPFAGLLWHVTADAEGMASKKPPVKLVHEFRSLMNKRDKRIKNTGKEERRLQRERRKLKENQADHKKIAELQRDLDQLNQQKYDYTDSEKKELNRLIERVTQFAPRNYLENCLVTDNILLMAEVDPKAHLKAEEYKSLSDRLIQFMGHHAHPRFRHRFPRSVTKLHKSRSNYRSIPDDPRTSRRSR